MNTQAKEILQISKALGGRQETLLEPAVVGDLILTSYSPTSRNTKFGFELHQNNYSKDFIAAYPTLVEGVEAAKLIKTLVLKYNIKHRSIHRFIN
jgi:glycerol-3-phosphate dehydrogenase (NAD(P)+)